MEKEPIIFYNGDENGIVVEKNDYQHSLFKDQYRKAFEVFHRIWNAQQSMINIEKDGGKDAYHGMDNRFSNIISFCGDRGEGKSSCMSSFTAMLTEQDARKAAVDSKLVANDYVAWENIELIDFIDPSFFDDQHNVLELLLGRMYAKVTEINSTNKEYEYQLYNIRQLREQFQKVKTSLAVLHKKDENNLFENLEELDELAAGIRLKKELDELFRLYLVLVKKERILICIDDMDLNMSQGYKMAELVRKYLIGKYCVILISVKLEQLVDVVSFAMSKELGSSFVKEDSCKQMAQKYVIKLLPQSNQIIMPTPTDFCERKFVMHDRSTGELTKDKIDKANVLLKDYVVRLIYQKTRYVFYNGRNLSPIVPENLRSLRHLVAALSNVEDAKHTVEKNGKKDEVESEKGRELFSEYLFATWAEKLTKNDYNFAQQLSKYSDVTSVNKFVLDYFAQRLQEEGIQDLGSADRQTLYEQITKKENNASNISFGDVMFVLWSVDKVTMNQDLKNLIFLIKTFYSMQLYKYYNQISHDKETLFKAKLTEGIRIYKEEEAYENINAYQRFVNGSMFTYPNGSFMPLENGIISRDIRLVSFDKVKELFERLKKYDGDQTSDEYITILRLCEFLALTISGTTTMREIGKSEVVGFDRAALKSPHLGQFANSSQTAIFDFLYPFYSLCNIQYSYGRYDAIMGEENALYSIASKNKSSLLNAFNEYVISERNKRLQKKYQWSVNEWNKTNCLISDALIRVVDVQWAICDSLVYNRDIAKSAGLRIKEAYKTIQNLKIKIYSLDAPDASDEKVDLWQLHFDFLDILRLALGDSVEHKGTATGKSKIEKWNNSIEGELVTLFEELLGVNISNLKYVEKIFDLPLEEDVFPLSSKVVCQILSSRVPAMYRDNVESVLSDVLGFSSVIRFNKQILSKLALVAPIIAEILQEHNNEKAIEFKPDLPKKNPGRKKKKVNESMQNEDDTKIEPTE